MRWSALVWWRVTMRRRSTLVRRRSTLVRRRTVSASRRRTVASRRRSPIPPSRRRRRRALLVVLLVIIIVRPRAVVFLRRLEPFRRRRQRLDAFAQRRHLSRQRFQRRAHLREPLARDRLQRPHARRDIFDLLVRARFHPLRRRLGASRVRFRRRDSLGVLVSLHRRAFALARRAARDRRQQLERIALLAVVFGVVAGDHRARRRVRARARIRSRETR